MAMMKPYAGQSVVVLHAHADGADMDGTVIKPGENEYKGKWWIDLKFTKIAIEPERIVDAKLYYARQRAKRAYPPQDGRDP